MKNTILTSRDRELEKCLKRGRDIGLAKLNEEINEHTHKQLLYKNGGILSFSSSFGSLFLAVVFTLFNPIALAIMGVLWGVEVLVGTGCIMKECSHEDAKHLKEKAKKILEVEEIVNRIENGEDINKIVEANNKKLANGKIEIAGDEPFIKRMINYNKVRLQELEADKQKVNGGQITLPNDAQNVQKMIEAHKAYIRKLEEDGELTVKTSLKDL